MNAARLQDGAIIAAKDYCPSEHGVAIYCMDVACQVPVHFVQKSKKAAFFKTTGKGDSVHKDLCAFATKMTFERSLLKVAQFQREIKSKVETVFMKINIDKLDPDYIPKTINRTGTTSTGGSSSRELIVTDDSNKKPQAVSTLKNLKKLFQTEEPDYLASIYANYNGYKLPITELISDQYLAAKKLWQGTALNVPYFIYGEITKIVKLEKVWYFNMGESSSSPFTLVVFEKYFKYFTYTEEELLNRPILVTGRLKKNDFKKGEFATEMIIKANSFIEFLDS